MREILKLALMGGTVVITLGVWWTLGVVDAIKIGVVCALLTDGQVRWLR